MLTSFYGVLHLDIIISVMGMPWKVYPNDFYWNDVVYILGKVSRRAHTTLPVLYNYVSTNFNVPEKVIVIVQETTVVKDLDSSEDYDALENVIRDTYMEFIKASDIENVEVIVAPGCGKFLNKGSTLNVLINVCGSPSDFYYYIFMKLASTLLTLIKKGGVKDLTIHLDISHGINYMPTLTRAIITELIPIVATYANLQRTKLVIYNSEPVTGKHPEVLKEDYAIHIIEDIIVRSDGSYGLVPVFEGIRGNLRIFNVNNAPCISKLIDLSEVGMEVSRESNELIRKLGLNDLDKLNAFVGSLINGLPLLALTTLPTTDLNSFVEKVIERYKKFIFMNVLREGNKLTINLVKKVRMTTHVKVLTKILLAKELIRDGIGVYDVEEGITLDELRNIINILYSWNERLRTVVSFDLYSLTQTVNTLKDIDKMVWTPLTQISKLGKFSKMVSEEECREEFKALDRFERNFLQHSGLHRCLTEIRINDMRIRYSKALPEDLLKKVYEIATKGLNKI